MSKFVIEVAVGLFVLVGLAAVVFLGFTLGEMRGLSADQYTLKARFRSVGGLKEGNRVSIAGVAVGRVEAIDLVPESFDADVTFSVNKAIRLDDDSIASIKTSGLIGDQFLSLTPGISGVLLEHGDTLYDTESAVDLESLIKNFAFGSLGKKDVQ